MIIGYVPLGSDGQPYRPVKNENHRWRKPVKHPVRVYRTKKRAETYSPVGQAKAVYIEEDN